MSQHEFDCFNVSNRLFYFTSIDRVYLMTNQFTTYVRIKNLRQKQNSNRILNRVDSLFFQCLQIRDQLNYRLFQALSQIEQSLFDSNDSLFDRIDDFSKKIHKFDLCNLDLTHDTQLFHVFVSRLFRIKDVLMKMCFDVHYFMLINDVKKTSRFKYQIACANEFFQLQNRLDFVHRKDFYF